MKKELLTLLGESDAYVSGAELSQALGVSRTAIWKQIQSLRDLGYVIEAQTRLGYRLISRPDRLSSEEVQAHLETQYLGQEILFYDEIGSTSELAKQLALNGAVEGTLVIAETQNKGKGRLGRSWVSPKGKGIWFSFVLRPDLSPQEAPKTTLVAAVAVTRALRKTTGLNIGIKWPNDLLYQNKKLVGILTEMNAEMDRINYLVIGIGINYSFDFDSLPPEIRDSVTSLAAHSTKIVSRVEILQACLRELEAYFEQWKRTGFAEIAKEWKELSVTLGKSVVIKQVEESIEGVAEDLEADGSLRLRLPDGSTYPVIAGDVFFS